MDTFVPLSWLEAAVGDWQECLDDWCFTFFSKIKSTRHWKDSSRQEYRFKKGALPRTYQFHKDIIMLPGQTQKSPPLLLDSILQLYSCFNQKHLHFGKLTWTWTKIWRCIYLLVKMLFSIAMLVYQSIFFLHGIVFVSRFFTDWVPILWESSASRPIIFASCFYFYEKDKHQTTILSKSPSNHHQTTIKQPFLTVPSIQQVNPNLKEISFGSRHTSWALWSCLTDFGAFD